LWRATGENSPCYRRNCDRSCTALKELKLDRVDDYLLKFFSYQCGRKDCGKVLILRHFGRIVLPEEEGVKGNRKAPLVGAFCISN
jgi:hypothetical protein